MEQHTLAYLVTLAASTGLLHTLMGPDHYVPFVAMARAGNWSFSKTMLITVGCGIGHVSGSVVLGLLGTAAGLALGSLEAIEAWRGSFAGWLLLGFGVAYLSWGLHRASRRQRHSHWHTHEDGTVHCHEHMHTGGHAHAHHDGTVSSMTPWILFTLFVFGPCEVLIPQLMIPAAAYDWQGMLLVVLAFGTCTILAMSAAVAIGFYGSQRISLPRLEQYKHAGAGFAMILCGAAIKLGL